MGTLVWLLGLALSPQVETDFAATSAGQSGQIIELYTSQGCSSCPPAEAWLSRLGEDPRLWRQIFPLAFHVTYWDSLGWRDPFGQSAFDARQYAHARRGHSRQVYTPQLLVNGQAWRGWARSPLPPAAPNPGLLTFSIVKGQVSARYQPVTRAASGEYRFHLALVGMGLVQAVTRGENRGRQLQQDFVVLAHRVLPARQGDLHFAGPLPEPLASKAPRLAWVGWIEVAGRAEQAAGGALPSP